MFERLSAIIAQLRPLKYYFWGAIVASIVIGIDGNARHYIVKILIDTIKQDTGEDILRLLSFYGISQIVALGAWKAFDILSGKFRSSTQGIITEFFFRIFMRYDYSFFRERLVGSLVARVSDTLKTVPEGVSDLFHRSVNFLMIFLSSFFFMWTVSFKLALLLFFWVLLYFSWMIIGIKKGEPLAEARIDSRSHMIGQFSDTLSNVREVHCASAERYERQRVDYFLRSFLRTSHKLSLLVSNWAMSCRAITVAYSMFVFYLVVYMWKASVLTSGDLAQVFLINATVGDHLLRVTGMLKGIVVLIGESKESIGLSDFPISVQDKPTAHHLVVKRGRILFKDVRFLRGFSESFFSYGTIDISPGSKIGIVGGSGSGKTTFIQLILRFFDPSQGAILIDGTDIRDVSQHSLRDNISFVPQDPKLFNRTIRENIKYGRFSATDEEMIYAAKGAQIHDFIASLSNGYDTYVGERGDILSGGQRQRIMIARAILKNAPILIFDESDSQTDSITVAHMRSFLEKFVKGKTVFINADKTPELLQVDRILVFSEGRIVQDGRHESLIKEEGVYQKLCQNF